MKVLIVGVNGKVGSLVLKNCIERGIDVSGLGRGENKNNVTSYIQKDVLALTSADLEGYDVVVDAVGGWTSETIPNITNGK